jgi:hypothetical protein
LTDCFAKNSGTRKPLARARSMRLAAALVPASLLFVPKP